MCMFTSMERTAVMFNCLILRRAVVIWFFLLLLLLLLFFLMFFFVSSVTTFFLSSFHRNLNDDVEREDCVEKMRHTNMEVC